jgi:WD40 repeat protein
VRRNQNGAPPHGSAPWTLGKSSDGLHGYAYCLNNSMNPETSSAGAVSHEEKEEKPRLEWFCEGVSGSFRLLESYVSSEKESRIFASWNRGPELGVWDAGTGTRLATLLFPSQIVGCVTTYRAVPDDSPRLAAACKGCVKIWDGDDYRELRSIQALPDDVADEVFQLTVYTDSREGRLRLVSGTMRGSVRVSDELSGSLLHELAGFESAVSSMITFMSSDGQDRLAAGSYGGALRVYDLESAAVLHDLPDLHSDWAKHVRCLWSSSTPPQLYLASAGHDGCVHVLEAETARRVWTLEADAEFLSSMVIWEDEGPCDRMATAGNDGTIRVIDGETGAVVRVLSGHRGYISSLVVFESAGGAWRLASGARDRTVRVWDPADGRCLHTLDYGSQAIENLHLVTTAAQGGRQRLAAVDYKFGGTVYVWDLGEAPCRTDPLIRSGLKRG